MKKKPKLLKRIIVCFFIICVSSVAFLWWYTEGRIVIIPEVADIDECRAIEHEVTAIYGEETDNQEVLFGCVPAPLTHSILVYRAIDPIEQNYIIELLKEIKTKRQTRPMIVYFYENSSSGREGEVRVLLRRAWVK